MAYKAIVATTAGGNWLVATPTDGTLPSNLTVSIAPTVLATLQPGTYSGSITVTSSNTSNSPQIIPVMLTVTSAAPTISKVVNAASYIAAPIAGGQILYLEGTNMGPTTLTLAQPNPNYPTLVSGVRILFDGVAAPLIYVEQSKAACVAPWFINSQVSTRVQVEYNGVRSDGRDLRVSTVAPGIFAMNASGTGQGAILNEDNSYNGTGIGQRAVVKGKTIQVYGTGGGVTTPAGVDGAPAPPILSPIQASYSALVGGVAAKVTYAGAAPGLISGMLQVNIEVPADAPSGAQVPLVILIGGTPTQAGITVAIQ
jgi:uncharacterized protein (TIGR03437 family)